MTQTSSSSRFFRRRVLISVGVVGVMAAAGSIAWGTQMRGPAPQSVTQSTMDKAALRTAEAAPTTGPAPMQVALDTNPGEVALEGSQLKQIKIATVRDIGFRSEKIAIGQIAFNQDRLTPVFSPYTGRVTKILARLGETVTAGKPMFDIDTPDLVQAESDLITAVGNLAKARNQLDQSRRGAARQQDLYNAKAVAQKDWEQSQSDVRAAESDFRSAQGTLAGARDRLLVFGKSEADIKRIEEERRIDRVTQVSAPLGGTVVTQKVGPGQYIKVDSSDPVFTIADLSSMWLLANVYEGDIPYIRQGQEVEVRVLAYPDAVFHARITYIAAGVDPATRRVAVRSEIDNSDGRLKPDMFAKFRILTSAETKSPGVPAAAILRESDSSVVWVRTREGRFAERPVKLGLEQEGMVQVLDGLVSGDAVVTEGAVFLANARKVAAAK